MKNFNIEKNKINNVLGLSCVENLIGAELINYFDISFLYYNSFLNISTIYKHTVIDKNYFGYFNKVQRIFDNAVEKNLIKYERSKFYNFNELFQENLNYCLVQVKPSFSKKYYKTKPWRNDHYVALSNDIKKDSIVVINDRPINIESFDLNEIITYIENKYIKFKVINTSICKNSLMDEFEIKFDNELNKEKIIEFTTGCNVQLLRDFVAILKIIRLRNEQFLNNYFEIRIANDYINLMNNLIFSLEYMQLKKQTNLSKLNDKINKLILLDNEFIDDITNKIKTYKGADINEYENRNL